MEFPVAKKTRSRKRRRNVKNRRRVQRRLEVREAKNRRKAITENISAIIDGPQSHTMDAHSFWENYKVAQEWQQRHSVAWWKSRCRALEYENHVLRQKIRSEVSKQAQLPSSYNAKNNIVEDGDDAVDAEVADDAEDAEDEQEEVDEDEENFEFEVDKDMLNFLEQSIRHKIELKRCRESETEPSSAGATSDPPFVTCEALQRAKAEDARLLYGTASPVIMAMEAALQATVDRHKDRAKPHYWPNIPLKL